MWLASRESGTETYPDKLVFPRDKIRTNGLFVKPFLLCHYISAMDIETNTKSQPFNDVVEIGPTIVRSFRESLRLPLTFVSGHDVTTNHNG